MKEININERIVTFCKAKRIKQVDLELGGCGSKQTVSHVWNNKRKPSADFLERLAILFEDLDTRWLLTGKKTTYKNIVE